MIVGAAVVGGVVLLRRQSTPAPPSSDPCANLPSELRVACEALGIGQAILNSIDDEAKARQLNGAVKKSIPAAFLKAYPGFVGGTDGATTISTDLEYINGCVPYANHPGVAKCAPGTPTLENRNFYNGGAFGADSRAADCSRIGTGAGRGDPLTIGPLQPSPGPGKESWWVGGELQTVAACASGSNRSAADSRTGSGTVDKPVLQACFAVAPTTDRNGKPLPNQAPLPPQMQQDDPGPTGTRVTDTSNMVWIPASGSTPGHWERKR